MRFPSFYADLYRSQGALNETPFGTNFLVATVAPPAPKPSEDLDDSSSPEDLTGAPAPKDSHEPEEFVLMPLELTQAALPPEQLKQEIQALTRLKHPGILAPLKLIEREHHHTQRIAMALLRRYAPGEPFLRFSSLATLSWTPRTTRESSGLAQESSTPQVEDARSSTEPNMVLSESDSPLTMLSEDTDEVSLIISEVSRSDRYEGIAPLSLRLERLTQCLPSMLDAMAYLHRYKRYHGALSPDCIFVDASHEAHIADAGLWAILRGHGTAGDDSSVPPSSVRIQAEHRLRQINLYRAPELFLGADPSSQADLYSLGCLLFHALCGDPPFVADDHDLAHRHIHAPRPSVLDHQPHCPSSWVRLIHDLMQVDPARRPTVDNLIKLVGKLPTHTTPLTVPTPPRATSFCGRPALLDELESHAAESRASRLVHPIVLTGGAGQGKHYFVDHLTERLSRRGWIVLRGRCYANAFDPYRGWRYLINDLVALLAQAPQALLHTLDAPRRTAATLFHELHPDQNRTSPIDPLDTENTSVQRLEATLALRAIFDIMSHQRPLLMVFDDLHLATRDTLELLHDVLALDTPFQGMILVTSAPNAGAIFPEREDDSHTHLTIPPLTLEESQTLLQSLGTREIVPLLLPLLEHLPTHAPQLIKELVYEFQHSEEDERGALFDELDALLLSPKTHTGTILRHVLVRRHARLKSELSVNILNVLSLYAGPLPQGVLTHAIDLLMTPSPDTRERDTELTTLATLRLVKRVSLGRRALISYRITGELCRTLVLELMDPEQLMLAHSAISKALTKDPFASTTQIFEHARRAGRTREAQRLADAARLEAVEQLAFSRAAEIQSWLVEQRKETSEVQRQELAELETASGQHKEAALLWQKMAEEQTDELDRIAALCEASEAWFYAGNFAQAQIMQEQALNFFGEQYAPGTSKNRWNALKLWWMNATNHRPVVLSVEEASHTKPVERRDELRARVHVLLLQTASMLNTGQAPTFTRRLRRFALSRKVPSSLAHAYQHHAQLLIELDLKRGRQHAPSHLEEALKLFAHERNFAKQAEVNVMQAYLAQCQGQWDRARALYLSAEELWRASSATTRMARVELDYRRGQLALWQGDLDEMTRMTESLFYEERHLAPAQVRGHQLATQRAIASGHLEDAAEHLHHITQHLTKPGISLLGLWHIEHTASLHIVRGEPEVALGRLDLAWSTHQTTPLYQMPRIRTRHKLKTAQALCALLTHEFYTDRPRRGALLTRTGKLVGQLRRQQSQLTTVELAALERVRMRHAWLAGKPRRALKILDALDEVPSPTMGKFSLMVQREVRGMLLQAIDHDEADSYLNEAKLAYDEHGLYAPLVQEGWPMTSQLREDED